MICYCRHGQVLALLYTLSFADSVAESRNMKAREDGLTNQRDRVQGSFKAVAVAEEKEPMKERREMKSYAGHETLMLEPEYGYALAKEVGGQGRVTEVVK